MVYITSVKWPFAIRKEPDRENRNKHVMVLYRKALNRDEFTTHLADWMHALRGAVGKGEALVFLHGYSVLFDDALRQTAQLAFDLKFDGAPILYSWPSAGPKLEYVRDKEKAEFSVKPFLELLKLVRTQIGADTVHVIAHSMGNKILVNTLQQLDLMPPEKDVAPLRHIVFAAPDIDDESFPTLAEAFEGKAERFTIYASTNDGALRLSAGIHAFRERLGRSVLPFPNIDTIDASVVCPDDYYCHALLASPLVIKDLNPLIHDDPPEQRSLTPKQSDNGLTYWELSKG